MPLYFLISHIIFIFGAMLLSTRTGLEYFDKGNKFKSLTVITFIFLIIGGFILGPIIQYYAFGAFWTGFPFGHDLTDNKVLIAFIFWLTALFAVFKSKQPVKYVIIASVVTFIVFLISHSLLGSELNYKEIDAKPQQEIQTIPSDYLISINQILTVSELTKEIRTTLEEAFEQVSVVGEISNFKSHISGHWYFSLKDSDAVINCTMWKGFNQYVFFTPQDGMKIIVNGRLTVYPPRGSYQLDVRSMKPAGIGELQEAFEKLKKKLEAEGLFDEAYKKEIPAFPKKIGIVTAIDGAAFKDLISVAQRRFPLIEIVIAPARVQGSGAVESIVKSIKQLNDYPAIDVIIVARGGGSIEDLWAFNEEIVVRAIFKSKVPIISGVGHEVDFTIADYVADYRAPTPSVAMEIATPDLEEINNFINEFLSKSYKTIDELVESKIDDVLLNISSYGFKVPMDILNRKSQQVDLNTSDIIKSIKRHLMVYQNKLVLLSKSIEVFDTGRSLKRGFVLVKQNSKFVKRASDFNNKEKAILKFFDGEITTK